MPVCSATSDDALMEWKKYKRNIVPLLERYKNEQLCFTFTRDIGEYRPYAVMLSTAVVHDGNETWFWDRGPFRGEWKCEIEEEEKELSDIVEAHKELLRRETMRKIWHMREFFHCKAVIDADTSSFILSLFVKVLKFI